MKIIYFILLIILSFNQLMAESIISIDNIRDGVMLLEYDVYDRTILKHDDRLFVKSSSKLEEFMILPDGRLDRLSFLEVKLDFGFGFDVIYDNRLYTMHIVNDNDFIKVTVFDITEPPFKRITSFFTNILFSFAPKFLFYGDHFFIVDNHAGRTVYYDRETYQLKGQINGLHGRLVEIFGNTLVNVYYFHDDEDNHRYKLKFFDIVDIYKNEFDEISEIILPLHVDFINDLVIQDSKITLTHESGVIILDISDISNPTISNDFIIGDSVLSTVMTENFLIVVIETGFFATNILFYDIDSEGNIHLSKTLKRRTIYKRNMLYQHPYIYINDGYLLKILDVSNNLEEVYSHGFYAPFVDRLFSHTEDDFYYFNIHAPTPNIDIYSALDNELICSVNFEFDIFAEQIIFMWSIDNDRLYVSYDDANSHDFYVYKIENKQATLLQKHTTDLYYVVTFIVKNNQVFFTAYGYLDQPTQHVYNISDTRMSYIGSFGGRIPDYLSPRSKNYIFNFYENIFSLRDINDFNEIKFSKRVNFHDAYPIFYNDEYVLFSSLFTERLYRDTVYRYDLNQNSLDFIHRFSSSSMYIALNGIITTHNKTTDLTEFYTINNNQVVSLGNKSDYGNVWFTNFFPKKNKLVQVLASGIWVYDFDYSVSDSDAVTEVRPTGLIGNYPNPFNPETVIKFRIENLELGKDSSHSSGLPHYAVGGAGIHARIDIYNIKGQKVRSLVDGYYTTGEHSVVWNGKDDSGVGVGSGVYFYRLTAGNFTETKKMVMIK